VHFTPLSPLFSSPFPVLIPLLSGSALVFPVFRPFASLSLDMSRVRLYTFLNPAGDLPPLSWVPREVPPALPCPPAFSRSILWWALFYDVFFFDSWLRLFVRKSSLPVILFPLLVFSNIPLYWPRPASLLTLFLFFMTFESQNVRPYSSSLTPVMFATLYDP